MGWLAFMVISDAIISPSRHRQYLYERDAAVIDGWAKAETFFKAFTHIDKSVRDSAPGDG